MIDEKNGAVKPSTVNEAARAFSEKPTDAAEPHRNGDVASTGNGHRNIEAASAMPAANGPTTQEAHDPFDPSRLRLSQDFAATLGVRKVLSTVPVRKPAKEWFIQVHPSDAYRINTAVLELKEDRETYLVERTLWPDLSTESTFSPRALLTATSRQGVLFLWPIRLPGADGKLDEWNRSALEAATMAIGRWVRVAANMNLGAYEVFQATGDIPNPQWPDAPFSELLRIAFKDRFITSLDHPVLRRLRGEA